MATLDGTPMHRLIKTVVDVLPLCSFSSDPRKNMMDRKWMKTQRIEETRILQIVKLKCAFYQTSSQASFGRGPDHSGL